jgi:hypothetical protein
MKNIGGGVVIFHKKKFAPTYKNENNLPLTFDLSQYFGGYNLRYTVSNYSY